MAPQPGETVTQIGLGMGYYSAILSLLVQPGGRLTGFEIDSELAEMRGATLPLPERVGHYRRCGGAGVAALGPHLCECGCGRTARTVAGSASPRRTIIFPWRPTAEVALAMLVKRVPAGFEARPLMSSWFIPCAGASSPKGSALAPTPSTARRIRSLHFTRDRPRMKVLSRSTSMSGFPAQSCGVTMAARPEAGQPKPDWWQVSGCPGGRHRRT